MKLGQISTELLGYKLVSIIPQKSGQRLHLLLGKVTWEVAGEVSDSVPDPVWIN